MENWQEPCYNINNGRCKSILRWKNTKNIIYEETTNNIIPILSIKRPHSRAFHLSIIINFSNFFIFYHPISLNLIKYSINNKLYDKRDNSLDIVKNDNDDYVVVMQYHRYSNSKTKKTNNKNKTCQLCNNSIKN